MTPLALAITLFSVLCVAIAGFLGWLATKECDRLRQHNDELRMAAHRRYSMTALPDAVASLVTAARALDDSVAEWAGDNSYRYEVGEEEIGDLRDALREFARPREEPTP